jgi:hypothetical protein
VTDTAKFDEFGRIWLRTSRSGVRIAPGAPYQLMQIQSDLLANSSDRVQAAHSLKFAPCPSATALRIAIETRIQLVSQTRRTTMPPLYLQPRCCGGADSTRAHPLLDLHPEERRGLAPILASRRNSHTSSASSGYSRTARGREVTLLTPPPERLSYAGMAASGVVLSRSSRVILYSALPIPTALITAFR